MNETGYSSRGLNASNYDSSTLLALQCNATFKAEPDIGGPGVLIAFLSTAYYLMAISLVRVFLDFLANRLCLSRAQVEEEMAANHISTVPEDKRPLYFGPARRFDNLLESLCDVQILTGISILIAGLSQSISLYHHRLVLLYWGMTCSGFWAASRNMRGYRSLNQPISLRHRLRIASILVSLALVIATIAQSTTRMKQWNANMSGQCYYPTILHTPWYRIYAIIISPIALLCLPMYILTIVLVMFDRSRALLVRFETLLDKGMARLRCISWTTLNQLSTSSKLLFHADEVSWLPSNIAKTVLHLCSAVPTFIALIVYQILLQFLSLTTCMVGSDTLSWILILIATSINTFEILDMKQWNASLLEGSESEWGFGQILPVVLLITPIYTTIATFVNIKEDWKMTHF